MNIQFINLTLSRLRIIILTVVRLRRNKMENKKYHHGDLKNSLIEAGITLINQEGEKAFSLRKVAALCGVSHTAPYSHFKNKEELLEAMQFYVTKAFSQEMEKAIQEAEDLDDPTVIINMGKRYVMFFIRNPQYYEFLFTQPCMKVNLDMNEEEEDNFPPFELLRKNSSRILKKMGMTEVQIKDAIIKQWAMVHGLAGIATMKNVSYSQNWEEKIEDFIK